MERWFSFTDEDGEPVILREGAIVGFNVALREDETAISEMCTLTDTTGREWVIRSSIADLGVLLGAIIIEPSFTADSGK